MIIDRRKFLKKAASLIAATPTLPLVSALTNKKKSKTLNVIRISDGDFLRWHAKNARMKADG